MDRDDECELTDSEPVHMRNAAAAFTRLCLSPMNSQCKYILYKRPRRVQNVELAGNGFWGTESVSQDGCWSSM